MSDSPIIVVRDGAFFSVLRKHEDWGIETYDLASPPRRFWADSPTAKPVVEPSVDARKIVAVPTPAQLLRGVPSGDSWQAQSRRSIARLWAHYLLCEDPQRRLDARTVVTLAHQVSLVRHVLDNDHLRRVMIADEVGLGKTVEVGLLLAELFEGKPVTRVLYLAPARLVNNVAREFDRLELGFRRWKSGDADARLDDPRIIASIHRATHPKHFDSVVGAGRWNVIVVDECHHLSDWAAGGGDPVVKFRLVRELANQLDPSGRLILMSGTPHQGHGPRFENLLRLLRRADEQEADLHGRVIYRTKEDIRDWRGNPLFPPRQVNNPIVLNLGSDYRCWLESIHDFYKPPAGAAHGQARQRAAGWRCAQALQWAASSPQAGLGFLVRQAIRSGWTLKNATLAEAIACLRPYRNGAPDEQVTSLYSRMEREVRRQLDEGDVEDIEDEDEYEDDATSAAAERAAMETLLEEGVKLLRQAGDEKWRVLNELVLTPAGDDKVVLFAQPIETVVALARYLERVCGERPAIIMGGQSDAERQQEEDRFRKRDGPRFLVSSRAGGEGINLQVARRLVHVDVPWNPMELEQRVGRVHRFGSRKTIIVDMLVVGESREADAYRIARNKLRTIASTLSPERFEMIFSRVMSLVPPEELQSVMLEGAAAPLSEADAIKLSEMVESGFRQWRNFHEQFHAEQQRIRQLSGGLADWEDIEDFLLKYADAEAVEGFRAQRFEIAGGAAQPVEDIVNVFRMADGTAYATGDTQGAPVFGPNDESVQQLGLNSPPLTKAIRDCAFPKLPTGAAHLRLESGWSSEAIKSGPVGLLAFLVQPIQAEERSGWNELTPRLACFEISNGGVSRLIEGDETRVLIRTLLGASSRVKGPDNQVFVTAIGEAEMRLFKELRRPNDDQIAAGIRHAVTPLFAAVVDRGR
jgi:superfamily II DNA or RNA helicase